MYSNISKFEYALSILILLSGVAQASTPATTTTTTMATTASSAPATTAKVAPAPAAATVTTAAAPAKPPEPSPSAKFSFGYEVGYSLQAKTQTDGSRSQSMSHSFKPGMSYGIYRMGASIDYEQDLIDTQGDAWSDPVLTLSRKAWTLNKYLKMGPSATLLLPLKESTRNDEGLQYAVRGALTLSLDTAALGMDKWSLGYQISANKKFQNFETNAATNSPNNSHSFRNRFTVGYGITDALSLFGMFDFNSNYSVNGVVTNSFFHLQSIGYSFTDNISASFSHSNGGPYLKSVTYENNLKFFDDANSSYSLGLEVSI